MLDPESSTIPQRLSGPAPVLSALVSSGFCCKGFIGPFQEALSHLWTRSSSLWLGKFQPPWVVNLTSWGFKQDWDQDSQQKVKLAQKMFGDRGFCPPCEPWSGPLSPTLLWIVWCIKLFYFEILFKRGENKWAIYLPRKKKGKVRSLCN